MANNSSLNELNVLLVHVGLHYVTINIECNFVLKSVKQKINLERSDILYSFLVSFLIVSFPFDMSNSDVKHHKNPICFCQCADYFLHCTAQLAHILIGNIINWLIEMKYTWVNYRLLNFWRFCLYCHSCVCFRINYLTIQLGFAVGAMNN